MLLLGLTLRLPGQTLRLPGQTLRLLDQTLRAYGASKSINLPQKRSYYVCGNSDFFMYLPTDRAHRKGNREAKIAKIRFFNFSRTCLIFRGFLSLGGIPMAPARNSASDAGPNVENGGMATHLVPFLMILADFDVDVEEVSTSPQAPGGPRGLMGPHGAHGPHGLHGPHGPHGPRAPGPPAAPARPSAGG